MPIRNYPVVELVAAARWDVREHPTGGGCADMSARVMHVPLGPAPHEVCVRAHEAGHVKWTGEDTENVVEGASPDAVQAVEDLRIHHLLAGAGVDMSAGAVPPGVIEGAAKDPKVVRSTEGWQLALLAVSAYGTGDYARLLAAFSVCRPAETEEARQVAEEAHARLEAAGPGSFAATEAVARWLTDRLGIADQPDAHQRCRRLVFGDAGPPSTDQKPTGDPSDYRPFRWRPGDEAAQAGWGEMTIHEPPLTLPAARRTGRWRAEDSGSYFRGPHRLLVDQRVFAVRRRSIAASILIDASGSMDLHPDDLDVILRTAPAAVVAAYSGYGSGGTLRVMARDGRRVTGDLVCAPSGSSNVVDGPALAWLGDQPGPRFWLSDGRVSGIGDAASRATTVAADVIVKRAKIRRLGTGKELIAAVARVR